MARRKLSNISTSVLQRELQRRQSTLKSLVSKRSKLAAELASLDGEIDALGGAASPAPAAKPAKRRGRPRKKVAKKRAAKRTTAARRGPKPGGKRPKNKMTLQDAIVKVLKGGTVLSVTEITGAVKKVGYKTNAENFRTIVNQTLIKNNKVFKKVARGQYTVK
ncbi:MAG: hypothetical protein D8M59_04660 [Planctomycetes bacterium]|nr:hypothetical protein [Planctomycetota bacterium]NOG55800.1 hypothetical protein [Planctomycetota bacterium]